MKKELVLLSAFLLAACGDDVTQINQTGMDIVISESDLPKCTDKNEGDVAYVKEDKSTRLCVDGEWNVTKSDGSDTDFSCKTVELKDGSGLKIVCNGDSIGVVLNGSDGKDGKNGKDGKDAVLPQDSLENDSERVAISLDSLVGYTQKGPFLKGSTVYLYELSDGRTLKQTNGNFTSNITRDDGRYKFSARDLVSQYAMIVVDGYYRNEVTGKTSDAPIRLKAITDMRKRSSVNVNILTHLEFERVYQLVTRGDPETGEKLTVKQAKRQAQKEIMKLFDIELDDNADAEDLDVFGSSDADAVLLALSIMLQGDRTESEMTALLSEISNAIVEKGVWTGARADSIKTHIADWIMTVDSASGLDSIRNHVEGWGLTTAKLPSFEKLVRKFASKQLQLGVCGDGDNSKGMVKNVLDTNSAFYAETYEDTASAGKMHRFICMDTKNIRWQPATDLEKDRFDWKAPKDTTGKLVTGRVTKRKMVWDDDSLRYAEPIEADGGMGCTSYVRDTVYMLAHQYSYYDCNVNGWELTLEKKYFGTLKDERDGKEYKTVGVKTQMWMAENLKHENEGSACYNDADENCDTYGRVYHWGSAMGGDERILSKVFFYTYNDHDPACPSGWHLPSINEWTVLIDALGGYSYQDYGLGMVHYVMGDDYTSYEYWSSTVDEYYASLNYAYYVEASPRILANGGGLNRGDRISIDSGLKDTKRFIRCVMDAPEQQE